MSILSELPKGIKKKFLNAYDEFEDGLLEIIEEVFDEEFDLEEVDVDFLADLLRLRLNRTCGNMTDSEYKTGLDNLERPSSRQVAYLSIGPTGTERLMVYYNYHTGYLSAVKDDLADPPGTPMWLSVVHKGIESTFEVCPGCRTFTLGHYDSNEKGDLILRKCPKCGHDPNKEGEVIEENPLYN